jgi:hypothetical protein
MATPRFHYRTIAAGIIAATAASVLASCAPANRAPETVAVRNPAVTYKYRGDQELLRANQQAAAFCNQYGTVPQTINIISNPDGTNTVNFECTKGAPVTVATPAPALPMVAPGVVNPGLTYTYRSERDLLDASRRADSYCMQYGQRMVSTSSIVSNVDGSRTATFQCGPSVAVMP